MPDRLNSAVELAENIRFSGDHKADHIELHSEQTDRINHFFSQSGLRISTDLTPKIFDVLGTVCGRLKLKTETVGAYVHSAPEIQAECFAGNKRECIVRVSSGLINLMSPEELSFVMGHEIGHFLLGHGLSGDTNRDSTEYFILNRCREVSADRLGLVACRSLKIAIRSLIKTTSGLDDDLLRFDVGSFLDQMRSQKGVVAYADEGTTHPSLMMRCRALLWFSMSDGYAKTNGDTGGENLTKIDQRITRDMEKYVDGPAREKIKEAREGVTLWLAALASVRDGAFDKKEQGITRRLVGEEKLEKLLQFYSGCSRNEVKKITCEKLMYAASLYERIAPSEFSSKFDEIQNDISNEFQQPDFTSFLSEFMNTAQ
jgi:hypothetical protein